MRTSTRSGVVGLYFWWRMTCMTYDRLQYDGELMYHV